MPLRDSVRRLVAYAVLATACGCAQAIELAFEPPAPDSPPQRRLVADPARPADAPESIVIEYQGIVDGPDTALRLAIKALNASRIAYGNDDPRTITPLINLGHARLRAGNVAHALKDFRTAAAMAESATGPRDPRLFEAWYGIAAAQFSAHIYDSAAESFETALQFHRMKHGLFSADQLDVLEALAITDRMRAKAEAADAWQLKRLEVAGRVYAPVSVGMAWTYIDTGRWFREEGKLGDALVLHDLALRAREKLYGRESPLLIGALLDCALSGGIQSRSGPRDASAPRSQQEIAMNRALRLAEARRDGTVAERARTLERIGDVNWVIGRRRAAIDAWLKGDALQTGTAKGALLDQPAFLVFFPPRIEHADAPAGAFLVAEFTVETSGRARNARIVEASSAAFQREHDAAFLKSLRKARLRPRIVDGEPAPTTEVRYRLRPS
ncbi:MAG TPA: hypothetical protein VJM11_07260 [Nevskiaceae bacterium]|nr:hypothetical protein [Nevskiaceae bacterium]